MFKTFQTSPVEFYRLSFKSFNLSALPLTQVAVNNAMLTCASLAKAYRQ